MPYDFAEHLFSATSLGMRVIVAPSDAAPVEIPVRPSMRQRSNACHRPRRVQVLESRGLGGPNTELASPDTGGAKTALDRITIPQEAEASPGSSLIISDEALSSETGKGTEFVVIMGDEPQGGIKMRRRNPDTEFRYASPRNRLPYWSPFAGPYSRW
jgi:hypothetical protein